jgi:UDP-glucose 6-dehydrogenase
VVVDKSTVPVGTAREVRATIARETGRNGCGSNTRIIVVASTREGR